MKCQELRMSLVILYHELTRIYGSCCPTELVHEVVFESSASYSFTSLQLKGQAKNQPDPLYSQS